MQDRYGNEVSTGSRAALDAYIEGVDHFLAAQVAAEEALKRAVAHDPSFALAHAALARYYQMTAQPTEALKSMISARELGAGFTPRERAHVAIVGQLIDGNGAAAYADIKQHVADHPRDVMMLQPCAGVFSLIAFSGRPSRDAETFAFFDNLKHHFDNDWWFDCVMAFALSEIGRLDEAKPIIERSFDNNPANANAAHYKAHFLYECGAHEEGRSFIHDWLKGYHRSSLMHCHISWHDALWSLELGKREEAWTIFEEAVRPGGAWGPPINVLTDMVSFLLRAEIAGEERRRDLWQEASNYASIHFPGPGISFVDAHSVIAHAMAGEDELLAELGETSSGTASDIVNALAGVYRAYAAGKWQAVIDRLLPVMGTHERLGGSRAQRDLLEFTLLHALLKLGKREEAERLFLLRRPTLTKDGLPPSLFPETVDA